MGADVIEAETSVRGSCANCGSVLERLEELPLDVAGREIVFVSERCPACGYEYMNAPGVLRPDAPLLAEFAPRASPIGTYRRVATAASKDPDFRAQPGDKVAGTLLWHALESGLADVVILAHLSGTEEPVLAFSKADLFQAWQVRMGSGRAVATGSGLRTNLMTLSQLKTFAERDGGAHPRIALMGRPCQVYTARKVLWDAYLPGYELALGLGTFCYGNFAPAGWGARRLREVLGFEPADIRGVQFGEDLTFVSSKGQSVRVPPSEVAGLVNANCLQCYDFSVSFSDVSVGHVGSEEFHEAVIVRTERGAQVFDGAVRDGSLASSEAVYGSVGTPAEEKRIISFLTSMVDVKKQLTARVRS